MFPLLFHGRELVQLANAVYRSEKLRDLGALVLLLLLGAVWLISLVELIPPLQPPRIA